MMHDNAADARIKREQLEAEKMTRRTALRKMGLTSGMALFGMFAVDDLARMTMQRLKQMHLHNEVVNAVAHDFKNVGVAFANPASPSSTCKTCSCCQKHYTTESNDLEAACLSGLYTPDQCATLRNDIEFELKHCASVHCTGH